jgi:peptide methionine sulfoxide reductase MsrB
MYEMSHSGHFFSDDPWDTGTSRRENVALELQLTAPGEWTLKRDNAELGKVSMYGTNCVVRSDRS